MPDLNTKQLYAQLLQTIGATDQVGAMRELARLHALDLAAQDRQASQADYPNPGAPARLRPAVQDDARAPRVLNAPARIWLNVGEILRDYEFSDLQRSGDVSWCEDKIDDHDVEYVRADLAAPAAQGEAVAWQLKCRPGGEWRECSRETFERGHCGVASHQCEVRELYDAPQPSAPGVVSDAMVEAACRHRWPTTWESFSMESQSIRRSSTREILEIAFAAAQPSADDAPPDAWADDDFYGDGSRMHSLQIHPDPMTNAGIIIGALCARLDTARRALAAAAAMQVVQPALSRIKDNAAWAMHETDPRRVMPRSAAYEAPPADARDAVDARRYRKIRHGDFDCALLMDKLSSDALCMKADAELDAAIDAAPDPADRAMGGESNG